MCCVLQIKLALSSVSFVQKILFKSLWMESGLGKIGQARDPGMVTSPSLPGQGQGRSGALGGAGR